MRYCLFTATLALALGTTHALAASSAVAIPRSLDGGQIQGRIELRDVATGVQVDAKVSGLPPGAHAMHIHEVSACDSGGAPGAHFHTAGDKKAGDLPDLKADAGGTAALSTLLPGLTVASGAGAVQGRAIMIHALGTGVAGHNHVIACALITKD